MASKSQTNGSVDTAQMLTERHARLIAEYASGNVKGAALAQVSTKIGDTEYQMELADIAYEPWIKPTNYTRSWTLSETDLIERISKASALANDSSRRDLIRDRASADLAKLTAQAEKRGIAIPA